MSALWLLLRLQFGGWWRFVLQTVRTLRGALMAVLTLSVLVPWLGLIVLAPRLDRTPSGIESDYVIRYGPAGLLAYVVLGVILAPSSQPIYFTPAEVQFLFAGPFTRRQLLLYKLVLSLLVSVPVSALMSLIVRMRDGWFLGLFLGVVLITCFLVLFSLVLALFASWLGASLHTRVRLWMAGLGAAGLVGLILWVGAAFSWDLPTLGRTVLDHRLWQTLTWPLASFFHLMTAQSWGDLLRSLAVVLGVNGLLVLLIFGLDARFLEQSAAGSAAIYARILRARGQTVTVEPLAGSERRRGWSLPMPPALGGIGPIVWRQLLTGFRSTGRLAGVFLILGATLAGPIVAQFGRENLLLLIGSLAMLFLWLSIILPVMVPFDFRGDIDRMATLKTLPIAPWRLALGQLLVPTLVLSLAKGLILVGVAIAFPAFLPYLGMGLVIVPAFNLYVIGVENLLFLLFPTRIGAVTPGDFQAMGRNILLSFGKAVGLFIPMMAGGIGFGVGYLTEWIWLGVLVGVAIVLLACAGLVALAGWAFTEFDAGRNTPA